MNTTDPAIAKDGPTFSKRINFKRMLILAGMLVVLLIILAPTIVTRTGLRDWLIDRSVPENLKITCENASFGWITPLNASGIQIEDIDQGWSLDAQSLRGDRTLFQLLSNPRELGTAVIEQSTMMVDVDRYDDSKTKPPVRRKYDSSDKTNIRVSFVDMTIVVDGEAFEQPSEFASGVDLHADYSVTENGRFLQIDPGLVVERAKLTTDMCNSALKFVAPVLADVAWTEGEVSLELAKCTLLLDEPEKSEVVGTLHIHNVQTGIRQGVAREISGIVSLAAKRDLPTKVKLADESSVAFTMKDGTIHHENLEFGLPDVSPQLVIRTKGDVGIDKSLDLVAELPLPLHLLGDGPIAKSLGTKSLTVPITGTLDDPKVRLDATKQLADDLISDLAAPLLEGDTSVEDLLSTLREIRENRAERRKEGENSQERGGLFQQLRERRRNP